jgi:hypothetical protein
MRKKGASYGCEGVAQVLSSTVNPVWNEHFDLLSYREADELTLTGTPFTCGLLRLPARLVLRCCSL